MFKLKINGVREEVEKLIKDAAEHFKLYDPRFPEESQCSGYHVFKQMCLMKEDPCSLEVFDDYKKEPRGEDKRIRNPPIGYYLISQLHPNARRVVLQGVVKIRDIFKKGQAKDTKIAKK